MLVLRMSWRLLVGPVGPEITTLTEPDEASQSGTVTGAPTSSLIVKVTATFSPVWKRPSMLFVPASTTLWMLKLMPGLTAGSLIGWRCASTGLSVEPVWPWQNAQERSSV